MFQILPEHKSRPHVSHLFYYVIDFCVVFGGLIYVFPQGFALWGEEPGSALDVDVLCFHGFHDEFFLFFIFWDKVFDLAGDKAESCFGQELPFRHGFMPHSFVSFPSGVAENWERVWSELVKELLDKSPF